VTLGSDIASAQEIWGSVKKDASGICRYGEYGISFSTSGNTITAIHVEKDKYLSTGYITDKGIAVGVPADAVMKCYGNGYERVNSSDGSGYNLDYKKLGIEFAIGKGEKVSNITIRKPVK
jgi:hypothetical protein